MVRGLDYYNGACFEIKLNNIEDEINPKLRAMGSELFGQSQNTLVAGGRYDYLAPQFGYSRGESLPAVGWAAGINRLMMITEYMEESNLLKIEKRSAIHVGIVTYVAKSEREKYGKKARLLSFKLKRDL